MFSSLCAAENSTEIETSYNALIRHINAWNYVRSSLHYVVEDTFESALMVEAIIGNLASLRLKSVGSVNYVSPEHLAILSKRKELLSLLTTTLDESNQ